MQRKEQRNRVKILENEGNDFAGLVHHEETAAIEAREIVGRKELAKHEARSFETIKEAKILDDKRIVQNAEDRLRKYAKDIKSIQDEEDALRKRLLMREAKEHKDLYKKNIESIKEINYQTRIREETEKCFLMYINLGKKSSCDMKSILEGNILSKEFLLAKHQTEPYSHVVCALKQATFLGDVNIIRLLCLKVVNYGIDLVSILNTIIYDRTLFQHIIKLKDVFLVQEILDKARSDIMKLILAKNPVNEVNAFMRSFEADDIDMVKAFLKKRPYINYNEMLQAVDSNGWNIFMRMAGSQRLKDYKYECFKVLLQNYSGVDWSSILTIRGKEEWNLLFITLANLLDTVLELLINKYKQLGLLSFVKETKLMEDTLLSYAENLYENAQPNEKETARRIVELLKPLYD